MKYRYCLFPLVVCLLISCASIKDLPIQKGILITNGTTITADDGAFTIKAGEPFVPQFQMGGFFKFNVPNESNALHVTDALIMRNTHNKFSTFSELYPLALTAGARKVLVQVSGLDKPLYGILALFVSIEYASQASPPVSYTIQIPRQYIDSALNGNISAVYVSYDMGFKGVFSPKSWALWLSSTPFPSDSH